MNYLNFCINIPIIHLSFHRFFLAKQFIQFILLNFQILILLNLILHKTSCLKTGKGCFPKISSYCI